MAVVKSKLLKQISDNYPNFLKKDLENFLNIVLNEIKFALHKGENVELRDYLKDVVINANKIIYLINKKKISTEGKTKIVIENKYYVNSSDVIFLKNEMQIFSDKFIAILDPALINLSITE